MTDVPSGLIDSFVAAARRAGAMGLARCSSGNLSLRVGDGRMLVTASKSWMADLRADQVVLCRIADAERIEGARPSIETRFHAGILRARPEMNAVLHFQSPAATTLACSDTEGIDLDVIIEMPFYIGPVADVPYLPPGSEELADATIAALSGHNMAQLRNHGQVTVGTGLDDAIQRAAFFELACGIVLRAGDRVRPLDAESVEALRRASGV